MLIKKFIQDNSQKIKGLVSVTLLYLIFKKINFNQSADYFSNINYIYLALAGLLIFAHVFLKSHKWRLLVNTENSSVGIFDAMFSYMRGTAFAIVTPARLGELMRITNLKGNKLNLSLLVLVDKVVELLVVIAFSIVGIYFRLENLIILVGIIIGFLCGILVLFNISKIRRVIPKLMKVSYIDKVVSGLELVSTRVLVSVSFFSILTMLIFFLQAFLLLQSFSFGSIGVVFLIFPLILLTNLIPITIGGFGVREGVASILLGLYGVPVSVSVVVVLCLYLFDTIIPGILGSIAFLFKTKKI